MKRMLFTPEQVIRILRKAETGKLSIAELCRKYGIKEVTFYRWRKRYQGMTVSDAKRLKRLGDENARLKKLLAERDLDAIGGCAQDCAGKKSLSAAERRDVANQLMAAG